jgi:hypothetical protein
MGYRDERSALEALNERLELEIAELEAEHERHAAALLKLRLAIQARNDEAEATAPNDPIQ